MKEVNSGASCDFRKVFIDRVECMYFQALAAAIRELDGDCSMPGIIPPVRQPPTSKPPAPTVGETPRTDEVAYVYSMDPNENQIVLADHMREIERELTAAQLQIDRLKAEPALLRAGIRAAITMLESGRFVPSEIIFQLGETLKLDDKP